MALNKAVLTLIPALHTSRTVHIICPDLVYEGLGYKYGHERSQPTHQIMINGSSCFYKHKQTKKHVWRTVKTFANAFKVLVTVVKSSVMERHWRAAQCWFSQVWNCSVLSGYQFECGSVSHRGCWAPRERARARCLNYRLSLLFSIAVFYFCLFSFYLLFFLCCKQAQWCLFASLPRAFSSLLNLKREWNSFLTYSVVLCLQFSSFSICWCASEMAYGQTTHSV